MDVFEGCIDQNSRISGRGGGWITRLSGIAISEISDFGFAIQLWERIAPKSGWQILSKIAPLERATLN